MFNSLRDELIILVYIMIRYIITKYKLKDEKTY